MDKKQNDIVKQTTLLLFAVSFCYALANGIPNVAINHIIEAFSIQGTKQGLIASTSSAGVMTAVIVAPSFQGRINKFKMLLFSTLLIGVSLVFESIVKTSTMFFLFSFTLGLGFGWVDGYMNSMMLDIYPNDSAKPMGLLHGFFGIGSLVLPIAATYILQNFGWNSLYLVCAVILMILSSAVVIVTKKAQGTEVVESVVENRLSLSDIGCYLKNINNIFLLIIGISVGSLQTGISCWIVRYTTLEFGLESLGATALSVMWIASTINRFIMPRFKVKPFSLLIFGLLMSSVALLVCVLINSTSFLIVAIAIVGLFSGHLIPMLLIEASRSYNGNTTMTTFIMQIALTLGRILIPIFMATVSSLSNVRTSMMLPAFIGLFAAAIGFVKYKYEKKV